jgi:hypothetical protein
MLPEFDRSAVRAAIVPMSLTYSLQRIQERSSLAAAHQSFELEENSRELVHIGKPPGGSHFNCQYS